MSAPSSPGGLRKSGSRLSLKKMGSQIFKKNSTPEPGGPDTKKPYAFPVTSTSVTADDLKWALEPSSATEGQTWYMTLDSGVFMFIQVIILAALVTIRIYKPDGTEKSKALSYSGSSFKVSEDKLSVDCEKLSVKYLPDTMGYHVKFEDGPECTLDFTFEPVGGLCKANDGRTLFTGDVAGGYVTAQFMPRANITGTILVDGVESSAKGLGLYLHAIQNKPQCVGKWNFINFQGPTDSLMIYEFEMPQDASYVFDIVSIGSLVHNGKIVAVTTNNRAVHMKKEYDDFSGYEVPTEIILTLSGKTTDGTDKDVRVELSLPLTNLAAKIDVLSELPFLLRKFIQTFITAPFLYQWIENVVAKVTLGEETFETSGRMLIECTFLMSLP
ncbi:putative cell survival pathways protein [Irineochytrium annulatum]|nr:putative cell survival pathways protein [Irineochytrium annulatum]